MNLYNPQQNQLKTIKLLLEQLLHQTSLLEQQDQPLRRLDLDVMLKRTHKLYETLCDIPVGNEKIELQEERLSQTRNVAVPTVEKVTSPESNQEVVEHNAVEKAPEIYSAEPVQEEKKLKKKKWQKKNPIIHPVEPKPERLPEPVREPARSDEPKVEQPPLPRQTIPEPEFRKETEAKKKKLKKPKPQKNLRNTARFICRGRSSKYCRSFTTTLG